LPSQIAQRLGLLLGDTKKKDFAERAGLTPTQLSNILSDKGSLGLQVLEKIADASDASLEWLVHGRGPRDRERLEGFAVTNLDLETAKLMDPDVLVDALKYRLGHVQAQAQSAIAVSPTFVFQGGKHGERDVEAIEGARWRERFSAVPLMADHAAAGPPSEISDTDVESFAIVYSDWVKGPGPHTAVRIQGQSMEPRIPDGSICGLDHGPRDLKDLLGRIVAARIEDKITIKTLRSAGNRCILLPDNPAFDPIALDDEDAIIALVTWWWTPAPSI